MALAGLRQGREHLVQSSAGGRGRWTPFISWEDGDTKTIAFLTSADEIAKVKFHNYVKVPADNQRGFNYSAFMCRKDPAWAEESGNTCQLCDVIGHKPTERHVALAVELEPVGDQKSKEFVVRTRLHKREDGTEVEYPQYGLVAQAFGNFYNYFSTYAEREGDITGVVFDIARKGNDTKTAYPVFVINNATISGLEDHEFPTLEEVLTDMGSQEKYDRDLNGVEPGSQEQKYVDSYAPEEATSSGNERSRTKFEELKSSLNSGTKRY